MEIFALNIPLVLPDPGFAVLRWLGFELGIADFGVSDLCIESVSVSSIRKGQHQGSGGGQGSEVLILSIDGNHLKKKKEEKICSSSRKY